MRKYSRLTRLLAVGSLLLSFAGHGRGQVAVGGNSTKSSAFAPSRTVLEASQSRRSSTLKTVKHPAHHSVAAPPAVAGGSLTAGNIYAVAGSITLGGANTGGSTQSGEGNYQPNDDGTPAAQVGVYPTGIALDPTGNLYIADFGNNMVREVPTPASVPTPVINRLAGSVWLENSGVFAGLSANSCGNFLNNGSTATCNLNGNLAYAKDLLGDAPNYDVVQGAVLTRPTDLKVDANGNIYFLNSADQVLEVLYEAGTVPGLTSPQPGFVYTLGGMLDQPTNAYAQVGPGSAMGTGDGHPATLATLGGSNFASYYDFGGFDGPAPDGPGGLFVDPAGNVYIGDTANNLVRVIYEAAPAPPVLAAVGITSPVKGSIYTIAGSYTTGPTDFLNDCSPDFAAQRCGDAGPATSAWLKSPTGVFVDAQGNVFIADAGDNLVRAIYVGAGSLPGITAPQVGNLYTVAGDITGVGTLDVTGSYPANACLTISPANCGDGGPALSAQLYVPSYVTEDAVGNLYISDSGDHVVRVLYQSGQLPGLVSPTPGNLYVYAGTLAGAGADQNAFLYFTPNACDVSSTTFNDCGNTGPALSAELYFPQGLAVDAQNNLYIADWYDGSVREVAGIPPALPQTIAFPAAGAPALPTSVVYGSTPVQLSATASSDLPVSFAVTGAGHLVNSTVVIDAVGTITITASQAGDAAFLAAAPVTATIQVTPAILTVTGAVVSVAFGSPVPNYTADYTISGFQYSDTQASSTTGAPLIKPTPAYTPTTPVGTTIALVASQGTLAASLSNYTFTFANGSLTVTGGSPQTINFPAIANQSYGAPPVTLAATSSSGLPVTYTVSAGSSAVSLSGPTLTIKGVAQTVTVTATQAGNSIYGQAVPVIRSFAINPAPLMVAANNLTVIQGGTIPPLTYSITGFVNSDTQATATTGAPVLTASATSSQPLGTYPIAIAAGTFTAANYTPNFVDGTLTIVPPTPQTITFPSIGGSVIYGVANIPLTATATSGLPVAFSVTGPGILLAHAVQVVGAGTINITATQSGNGVYGAAPAVTQTLAVAPAALTVTANSYTIPIATADPALGYTISGFVDGDTNAVVTGQPTLTSTDSGPVSPPGVYPILIALNTLQAENYTFNLVGGTITVLPGPPPDYSVTVTPTTITMSPGQVQQATLFVVPINGYVNKYNASTGQGGISFSCGSLPANVTCTFSPMAVSVNGSSLLLGPQPGGGQLATLTIDASGATAELRHSQEEGRHVVPAALFFLPGALTGIFLAFNRRRLGKNLQTRQSLVLFVLLSGVLGMGACGYGNTPNTSGFAKPGTTSVVINAVGAPSTSSPTGATGSLPHSINLTVTIQ